MPNPDTAADKLAKILNKQPTDVFTETDIDQLALFVATLFFGHRDPINGTPIYSNTQPWQIAVIKDALTPSVQPWLGKPINQIPFTAQWTTLIMDYTTLEKTGIQNLVDGITTPLQPLVNMGKSVTDLLGLLGQIFGFLLDPANWVRSAALLLGLILLWKGTMQLSEQA